MMTNVLVSTGSDNDWNITWTNVDLSSMVNFGIHSIVMPAWIIKLGLKFTNLKSQPHSLWDDEFVMFSYHHIAVIDE